MGRRREAVSRRDLEPVVREHRSRPPADGRRDRGPTHAAGRLLDLRRPCQRAGAPAVGPPGRARAARGRPCIPDHRRRRRNRNRRQARPPVLQRLGPDRAHARDRPRRGLPRRVRLRHRARRDRAQPRPLRTPHGGHLGGRLRLGPGARAGARAGRPQARCRVLLRAGDGRRRGAARRPGATSRRCPSCAPGTGSCSSATR